MKVLAKARYTMDLEAFGESWTPEELMAAFKRTHGPFPARAIIEVKTEQAFDLMYNKLAVSFVAKLPDENES